MRPVSAAWKTGFCGRTSNSPLHITRHLVSCPGEHLQGSFFVGRERETRGKNAWRGLGTKGFAQKKVLSLVLCVAMLLSVMVMGTGAAFTDQDEIQNAEAVDMTSALGIIDGYEDGSFQPAENIERGEAAKMISAMLNGGRDSVQETTESSYNDVLGSVDAWANKYIEYCTARGIVSGVGGDRFAPASNVTGTQLAKMLLVSLGYDSVKEGYQDNAMWSVNVNTDAVAAGLYAGIETIDMSAPLSRDNAAQMIWNALQANTVYYLTNISDATVTDTTLLDKVYGARVDTGIMEGIRYNQDTKNYTYTIQPVDSSAADNGTAYTVESTTDYSDLFAMNVTVLHKDDSAMMIRVNEGGTVVEGTIGDIGGTSNTHFNTITVDGQKYTLDNVANDWDNLWSITCGYNQYNELGFWGFPGAGARHTIFDQYSFRAIDQDGGGDIDVIVVYPYVVMRTETVLNDTFVAREIVGDDASLTVAPQLQARGLIAGILFDGGNNIQTGPMSAEIEYEDIVLNGTVAENGYVKVVPAAYTAEDTDTYTVLDINSGVANSLNTNDSMITFGTTEYDGNLVNRINPVSTISLGETYGFVEVNGYLFIVDGNNIGPVKDEYVVVTKTALAPQGVDKTWETNILKTDGTTETVNVYVSLNDQHYGPEVGSLYTYRVDLKGNYELIAVPGGCCGTDFKDEYTNFDIQQAYKDGATLNNEWTLDVVREGYWTYAVTYVGNKSDGLNAEEYNLAITLDEAVGAKPIYYNVTGIKEGVVPTQFEAAFAGADAASGDITFHPYDAADTYYFTVTATWTGDEVDLTYPNGGISDVYGTNTAGGYFTNQCKVNHYTEYQIEDDAVIFVYNRMMDEYSVVKGSDLENIAVGEISWAFTGATAKVYNGTPTVDLGYVAVDNDPDEVLIYAYVDSNPIRTMDADGNYILTVDVIVNGGEKVTLTAYGYDYENDPTLMRLFDRLTNSDDGIFQLIVDDSTLIDVKEYQPAVSHNVTAALHDGIIELGGTKYFVDADTEFIPTSGNYDSISEIPQGVSINIVPELDDNGEPTGYVLAVIA